MKPNTFVSSTCYDLSQVRDNLRNFLIGLGHSPMLSEFSSFPVDPNANTVKNCIQNIENQCDLFVLIIGNRFGSSFSSGKSITNLEFETAVRKGIPIYAFISKSLKYNLPIFLKNQEADFTDIVDNVKVFQFADRVINQSGVWTFEFDKSDDIIEALRVQFAYLFKSGLDIRKKIQDVGEKLPSSLSPSSLKIIIDCDTNWRLFLLNQMFLEEFESLQDVEFESENFLLFESKYQPMGDKECLYWLETRFSSLVTLIQTISKLCNDSLQKYFDHDEDFQSIRGLIHVTKSFSKAYKRLLEWPIETAEIKFPSKFKGLIDVICQLPRTPISGIREFTNQLHDFAESIKKGEESDQILQLTMEVTIDKELLDKHQLEIDKLSLLLNTEEGV